jgi:radical SAM protein (TIGR01212 family)
MYYKYSDYLKEKYNEKVYKLPINLPLTCPNRDGTKGVGGCIFCSSVGAGFETKENTVPIEIQLKENMDYIGSKYKANKFIAYFQNFTNTYLPADEFYENLKKVTKFKNIVEIAISTRPDCIDKAHLDYAKKIKDEFGIEIMFEMGLQTANDNSLKILNRGHTVSDFKKSSELISSYGFLVGAHIILGLFCDTIDDVINSALFLNECKVSNVKCHSLYIVKNTRLAEMYKRNEIKLKTKEEFINEVITFLSYLNPDCPVQRLLGRAPEEETVFENWGHSWRKILNEIEEEMKKINFKQGYKLDIK